MELSDVWIWAIIAVSVAFLVVRSQKWNGPQPSRHVFASQLSEDNLPEGEKQSFSLKEDGRMVLFIDWACPDTTPYTYRCRIYDGKRRQVHESAASMAPTDGAWSTWTWYDFDSEQDAAGQWRYQISVDGVPVLSAVVQVSA